MSPYVPDTTSFAIVALLQKAHLSRSRLNPKNPVLNPTEPAVALALPVVVQ
jgi:hypothetical protein